MYTVTNYQWISINFAVNQYSWLHKGIFSVHKTAECRGFEISSLVFFHVMDPLLVRLSLMKNQDAEVSLALSGEPTQAHSAITHDL